MTKRKRRKGWMVGSGKREREGEKEGGRGGGWGGGGAEGR